MHPVYRHLSALVLALTLSSQLAFAESDPMSNSVYLDAESGDPTGAFPAEPKGRPLTVNEAIALGLRNNLDVEVNRYTPYTSQLDSEAAWGAYDPTFTGNFGYQSDRVAQTFLANQVFSDKRITGDAGIEALIPYWGASVGVTFDSARTESTFVFEQLNPRYSSGLAIEGNVPLMRGLIWNEPWTQIKTSRLSYDADLDNFSTSVMDTVQDIINAYWNLVATKEQVRVAEKSLESNQALLDQTETQYDVGVVSKVEVVQAEAGVANSEFNLIVARNDYRNSQDTLISAVLGDRLRADTILTFDPIDSPEFQSVTPVDLNQAVQTAFMKRPELAAAERRLDQGEVQLKFAKNQRLPQVDLSVRYRTNGVDGRFSNTGAPFNGGTYPDTFDSWYTDNGPRELRAMGVISIPLGNVAARKNVSKARIELRQANSEITQLKQEIIVSVRSAARGLLASAQGVEAAERRRIAAEEQLRAEKIRLEHGESTPFDVLQRESDLVDAESQKIQALQSFRDSEAELERQQGTILDAWNVQIDSVRKLELKY